MATAHASQSYGVSGVVPSGWLVPFTWIKVGRPQTDAERVAHVRLLIPHSYGTTTAAGSVNAYFYDLLIQRGRVIPSLLVVMHESLARWLRM